MMRSEGTLHQGPARFRQSRAQRIRESRDLESLTEIHTNGKAVVNDENARLQVFFLNSASRATAVKAGANLV